MLDKTTKQNISNAGNGGVAISGDGNNTINNTIRGKSSSWKWCVGAFITFVVGVIASILDYLK